ncbi:hypothetical protein EDD18DRAFT_1155365 [Armillaria luteobubalina]|uniref:Protein-S-isoprenylcysteine O-methyltransferase n=1 Tax=Armillaria luteobubalina TaxID=153913 RepID=A0AA39QB53_9AGAR|nr:hypothetical protein EDD18DRAFT_1155365 [Armillaria luteobubalina]
MLILKIPILVLGVYHIWRSFTPPHRPTHSERLPPSLIGRFAVPFVSFMKLAHSIICACEIVLILSYYEIPPHLPTGYQSYLLCARNITITPTFLIGSVLAIAGAQLRLVCYRTLGRLFTFEMAIRKDHKLITAGPYAYVRHPAYAGLLMTMAGEAIIQCSRGSWLRECGLLSMFAPRVYLALLIFPMLLLSYSSTMRGIREDKSLEELFGDEWRDWAKRTPYRLIPSIY